MAGASAVQIGSAIYKYGINIFDKLNNDLNEFFIKNDINDIKDIIGVAIK
jgi:dihydroorotate dehydrogenase (NAD+) catalytic subunit